MGVIWLRFLRAKTADEACVARAFIAWDFGDMYEEDGVGGQMTPVGKWEVGISAGEARDEVIFECLDGAFG